MTTDAHAANSMEAHFFWPNKMGRMFLLALEDVTGKNGVNAILNQAGLRHRMHNYPPDNLDLGWSFEEMSALNQALDEMHGRRGGRGLAVRAGRAWFRYASRDIGAVLGIADVAFRLLPLGVKIKLGINAMADTFNKTSDEIVRVEEKKDQFLYHIERCPVCWGRTAEEPICHANLGLLEEGLHWVTGGKRIPVDEFLCIAKGDPSCTYRIGKRPLD
jgi:predicted hydrocarbon binding protein